MIGVPGEGIGTWSAEGKGAIQVLYGTPSGLAVAFDNFFHQEGLSGGGASEAVDSFGDALAAGDINGDGRDDLAVGVPYEDLENLAEAGAVSILWGAATGLTASGGLFLHQGSPGVADASEASDYFGGKLLLRDFNRDGKADLFVGIWGENGTGAYQRFWGSAAGLELGTSLLRFQPGQGAPEAGDLFGMEIELGDFDGNGRLDLAVGAPAENLAHILKAGQVDVTYSAPPEVIGFQ